MDRSDPHYVHGTEPTEQARLSRLNALLNANSLSALDLRGGERVLDVGAGLAQFTRLIARRVGPRGHVVGVERDERQLTEALRQARAEGEGELVELRCGDAVELPLAEDEWGSFDVAHARFLLEHVTDVQAVVRSMFRAVRPGGRIVLEDDDHDVLRLWPEPPGVLELWRAYYATYRRRGKEPYVGRHLVSLLHGAGARPRANRCLFFGSCAGSPNFEAMVENFLGVILTARKDIVSFGLMDEPAVEAAAETLTEWSRRPDAALWYTSSWAEGVRPSGDEENEEVFESAESAPMLRPTHSGDSGPDGPDENTLLRFLMFATSELSSSLELDKVFHKIATWIRPLIDYHLFCIMLWNEREQMLEHSFSMKYGRAVPQRGGFALGYGISGSAASLRRPVRVADVLLEPRYVRFRHPEVEIRSEMAVPLIFKDQLIGVLDLESTEQDYFTDEHEQMVTALAAHMASALANARLHERVVEEEQRLERELQNAREIQRRLLPRKTPRIRGLQIGSLWTPARQLGGDFYDYMKYGSGRLALAVGDVAGKATPAALLASMVVGLLRGHVMERPDDPGEMLARLNEPLETAGGDNRFVAMFFAVYDAKTRRVVLANAGMPHARIVRNGRVERSPLAGIPLGLFPGTRYETAELDLPVGDIVVLCSDGLLEAENEREESFEACRLEAVLLDNATRSATQIASALHRSAVDFAGGEERQRDDYTAVVLKGV